MNIKEFLIEVKNLIIDPKHWTKQASARANQMPVYADNPNADCWCLLGAIERVNSNTNSNLKNKAENEIRITLSPIVGTPVDKTSIHEFNDRNTHSRVIEIIDLTINRLQL